jgi:hypothetical protein
LQARSAFEASLYIELLLEQKSDHRACTYLVGEYRKRRTFALSVLDKSDTPGSFNHKYASIRMHTDQLDPQALEYARRDIDRINIELKKPWFSQIDAEYEAKKRKGTSHDPAWYQCLGFQTVHAIAKKFDHVASYDLWYNQGSKIMHAESFSQQISVLKSGGFLKPLRHLELASELCSSLSQTAIRAYRLILEHYRPVDIPAFVEKYKQDWRRPFHSNKQIAYVYRPPDATPL